MRSIVSCCSFSSFWFILMVCCCLFFVGNFVVTPLSRTLTIRESILEERTEEIIEDQGENDLKQETTTPNEEMTPIQEETKQEKDEEIRTFQQPTFKNEMIDTTQFNYEGDCGKVFKYKPNNKRDLVFHAIHFKDKNVWKQRRKATLLSQQITQSGIPHATRVLVVYGKEPEENFTQLMESVGVQVIQSDKDVDSLPYFNPAVERFLDFETYLKQHQNEYDRVVITDFGDIAWFADGFATFSPDEFFVSTECWDYNVVCNSFTKAMTWNAKWVKWCYGDEVLSQFVEKNSPVINIGFVYGNVTSMLKYLQVYTNEIRSHEGKCEYWGLDQGIVNYIYNSGLLNELNVTVNRMTQRYAFNNHRKTHRLDKERKVLFELNGDCSPVIRHKMYGYF